MKPRILAFLLLVVLLYGCTQSPGARPSTQDQGISQSETTWPFGIQPATQGDTGTGFNELDAFSSSDVEVSELDPGPEFSFDETQFQ